VADLTVHERLLLVAADLEKSGKRTFSAEDLVVASWKRFPDTFGLAGYNDEDGRPLYPNSNRVFAEIMGSSKPLRKLGLIAKSGTKRFHLTEAGRQRAALLGASGGERRVRTTKASFSRETARELQKILSSRAVAKYGEGRADEITFHDASSFWGISARSTANEFTSRVADTQAILRAAADAAGERPIVLEHGSKPYTAEDIENLRALHDYLLDRFETELSVIRRRTDERL